MSFTMFSAVLLLVVGAGVFIEVMRGMRRGLVWTAVSLSTVVLSALIAAPLAVWLSDTPAQMLRDILLALLPTLETLSGSFPAIIPLLTAGADAVISPIFFVLFFLVLRLIARIVVSILFRSCLTPLPDDPADPMYESENAPWHRRHGRLVGGLAGGLCGFIASLILLSPVVGVLSTADRLLAGTDGFKIKWDSLGLDSDLVATVRDTTGDPAVVLLEALGCGIIFDASACTELNGNRAYLRREADVCMEAVEDMVSVISLIRSPGAMTPEQREAVAHLGDTISGSEAAKMVAADTVNLVADAWLEGNTFMKVARPAFGELIDPLMTGVLQVCSESEPSCVGRDIGTLLNVYLIAVDHGMLTDPDYEELANSLGEDGVLNLIYDELMKNPCTAHLAGELTDMSLRIMVSAIEWSDISNLQIEGLMSELSDAMNQVNGMGTSAEERVEFMKEYTLQCAEKYGVKVPPALAEMASIALIERLGNRGDTLTSDDLLELFETFASGQ